MRHITDAERRARLQQRQFLGAGARAGDVTALAGALAGLHSSDPATVVLAARARHVTPSATAVEDALYEQRTLVRMLGMRRTMFVVPVALAPAVQGACTRALIPGERKRFVAMLEGAGIARDGARWLRDAEEATVRALAARGSATAAQLAEDVPALKARIAFAQDKPYAGVLGATTKVLFLLSAAGRIVRGRPLGTWTSALYRWSPMDAWLGEPMPELDTDTAAAQLVRHWLATFGPGTLKDLKWWTGWTTGLLRRALAQVPTVEVALDGGAAGLVLAGDDEPVPPATPGAALLPGLDPTPMGYGERAWYLGPHRAALFDRSGNIGPTVWWDGRIVGGWAQRKAGGEVVVRLLEDVGGDAAAAIDAEAQRLQAWLGELRVTPRFRTPLERELSAAAVAR